MVSRALDIRIVFNKRKTGRKIKESKDARKKQRKKQRKKETKKETRKKTERNTARKQARKKGKRKSEIRKTNHQESKIIKDHCSTKAISHGIHRNQYLLCMY